MPKASPQAPTAFDRDEFFDAMLFAPMYWFATPDQTVTAAFVTIDDAWRWALTHPDELAHPYFVGSSVSERTGRAASWVTRLGYDWFAGWCVGKAIAIVK